MIITDLSSDAVSELEKFHKGEFPVPDLDSKLYLSKKAIIDGGELIGAVVAKLTCEGILILDENSPIHSRVIGSRLAMNELRKDLKLKGLEDCHVFVQKLNVQKFLQMFGFEYCKGGTPMVIQL